jgi:hypothetical protein
MPRTIADADRIILDRLLSSIAERLDGAVEMWSLVCLGPLVTDRRGFLLHYGEILRAHALVAQALLPQAGLSGDEAIRRQFDTLVEGCRQLQDAFLVLEQFRVLPLEEVRNATESVAELYRRLRAVIRQLGDDLSLAISYWQNRAPERDKYYQDILHRLFELFCHELGVKQPVGTSS